MSTITRVSTTMVSTYTIMSTIAPVSTTTISTLALVSTTTMSTSTLMSTLAPVSTLVITLPYPAANLISTAGGEDILRVGVKAETVDLGVVGFNAVRRLAGGVGARVPDHQLLVVADGTEQRRVQQVPGDVFHYALVTSEGRVGVEDATFGWGRVHVPEADRLRGGEVDVEGRG